MRHAHDMGHARSRQRGIAAIEFGLVMPILCLLIFGLIDYGYWFTIGLAATNAAREGARSATTIAGACPNGGATTEGTNAITSYITGTGLGGLTTSPTCSCTTVASGPQFQCSVTVSFQRLTGYSLVPMPAAGGGLGSDYTSVQATATMRGTN